MSMIDAFIYFTRTLYFLHGTQQQLYWQEFSYFIYDVIG
jgi:hypothetical protein